MSQKIIFKEKTSIENVQLIKMESKSNYYARKYYGKKGVPQSKKYKLISLETSDIEVARNKILEIDIPSHYTPREKLSTKGASLINNRGYKWPQNKPSEIGVFAEHLFVGRMYDLGYEIYKPFYDVWASDFVVYKDNIYNKVQVKASSKENYNVHLRTRDGRRYVDYVDYIAFISFAEDKMYYIPIDKIPPDASVLTPNFMKKYILPSFNLK